MTKDAQRRLGSAAMTALRRHLTALVCGLMALVFMAGAAAANERRVALVVGNGQYKVPNLVLSNPKNDADDVAAALRDLGFEVVHASDANKRDFDLALAKFARLATGADAALFYYAGHALQFQGKNYLMPIDAELEDEVSLRFQMESTDDVRAALDRASGVKIMILDACRNNPIADRLQRRIAGESRSLNQTRGLARIDRAQGIVVSYATAADQVAQDGGGRNSPYTRALLKRLQEPGLEIEMMFRRIAADVNAQTNGQQRPETYVSLISEFYINQKDRQVWNGIKSIENPEILRDFVELYPNSIHVADAQARLRALERVTRERQAAKEQADREAVRVRQFEEQRLRIAALERERLDRESVERRQQEEVRAREEAARKAREQEQERQRLAALERERQEREAAQQRQQDEQRAKVEAARKQEEERARVAALERERKEREAAQQREAAEQRARAEVARKQQEEQARLAALERERQQREAEQRRIVEEQRARVEAARKQDEERARLAALERERKEREAARQREAAEQRARAEAQRKQEVATAPPPATPQADSCKQDEERLARLRAAPEREEVLRFERELTCARLRSQVTRLRESVAFGENLAALQPRMTPQPSQPQTPARTQAAPQAPTPTPLQPASISPEQACKQDEEQLARLRANPDREEIIKFERELACMRLRAQVARLRESVGGGDRSVAAPPSPAPPSPAAPHTQARKDAEPRQTAVSSPAQPPLVSREQACKRDEEKLARLRASRSLEDITRFARELGCERLRPQVLRLRESVQAN